MASTLIRDALYNPITQVMRVVFQNGDTFDYANVDAVQWQAYNEAESQGKWFISRIRSNPALHPFTKVEEGEIHSVMVDVKLRFDFNHATNAFEAERRAKEILVQVDGRMVNDDTTISVIESKVVKISTPRDEWRR